MAYSMYGSAPARGIGAYQQRRAPLVFSEPPIVCIAPDGFVFAVDAALGVVHVLTPTFQFHSFFNSNSLEDELIVGVCANNDVVAMVTMSECVYVLDRASGAALCCIDDFKFPTQLCFTHDGHLAVARTHHVHARPLGAVYSIHGERLRELHLQADSACTVHGIACTRDGHLLIATSAGLFAENARECVAPTAGFYFPKLFACKHRVFIVGVVHGPDYMCLQCNEYM
jgi:hypothetical protein